VVSEQVEVLDVPPEKESFHANEKQLPLIFVVTLQLRNSGLLTWPSPGSVQLPSQTPTILVFTPKNEFSRFMNL
jgi:hypothetical protein